MLNIGRVNNGSTTGAAAEFHHRPIWTVVFLRVCQLLLISFLVSLRAFAVSRRALVPKCFPILHVSPSIHDPLATLLLPPPARADIPRGIYCCARSNPGSVLLAR